MIYLGFQGRDHAGTGSANHADLHSGFRNMDSKATTGRLHTTIAVDDSTTLANDKFAIEYMAYGTDFMDIYDRVSNAIR